MSDNGGKLGLWQAVSMSVGGMMGGVFPVLGEAVELAGRAAWLSFAMAGVLALITAVSYSRLSCGLDASGAKVINLLAGTPVGGTLNWALLLGYILTTSLYAAAFGEFAARLVGRGTGVSVAVVLLIVLGGLNLCGVQISGRLQSWLVQFQFLLLLAVGAAAAFLVGARAPVDSGPALGSTAWLAVAGVVLVAYEGFELLSYSYEEIASVMRILPKASWISVWATVLLYVLLAFGVAPIGGNRGAGVLMEAGRLCFGKIGAVLAGVAALLATAAAVNATFFATGRLARRVSKHRQLPHIFKRWHVGEASVLFVLLMIAATVCFQFVASLKQMVSFASFLFLVIFAVFNFMGAGYRHDPYWTVVPFVGGCGCVVALFFFARRLYLAERASFWVGVGMLAGLLCIRLMHLKGQRHPELEHS